MGKFAETVASCRLVKGMSQRALCRASGLSPGYMNHIEVGKVVAPPRRVRARIAEALGVEAAVLDEAASDERCVCCDGVLKEATE